MKASRRYPAARYVLLGAVLLLALVGLVMIYSASMGADAVRYADSAYHLKRQAMFLAAGLAFMWLCSRLSGKAIERLASGVWGVSVVALVIVLAMGLTEGGAQRWLSLGAFAPQPSELAKLGCVLMVAGLLAERARRPRPWWGPDLVRLSVIVGVPFVLILVQPDMGAAMALVIPVFLLLVLGGLRMRYILAAAAAGAVAVPLMIALKPYRFARYLAFLNPSADPLGGGYQVLQAQLAFGSGGILGVGLGLSRQKFFYLPAAHTDFIFAIIGEELGLWGTLLVVSAFALVAWAGFRIARDSRDHFGRLLAGGFTLMIVTQALINMASVTGIMPVAGEPLPLVSYGGSSLVFTMGCVGLILSVARQGLGRAAGADRSTAGPDEETNSARTVERRGNGRPRLSVVDGGRASTRRRAL